MQKDFFGETLWPGDKVAFINGSPNSMGLALGVVVDCNETICGPGCVKVATTSDTRLLLACNMVRSGV